MARLGGTLALVDGCLVVLSGNDSWVIVWPSPRASWNPQTQVMDLGGVQLRVGDAVALGGGEGRATGAIEWVVPPSDGCLRQKHFWYTQGLAAP